VKLKAVEFLNPEKSTHIIVPEYLKQIYLDSNYHLLPNNVILKKIVLFINIKILRKFKIILNFLFKKKFTFKEPSQKEIIVFDDENFRILNNIFSKQNYFILATRIERIKEIYLSKKIFLYILRNLFKRSLKQNYLSSLIEIIQPKTIVTFIDNSNDFFIISKIFKGRNIKFIAIQNAHRYDVHSQNKNLYIPNYFVVGTHEVEVFKKNSENISKIKSIGSLTAAVVKNHFEKNNIKPKENLYDICLISEPRLGLNFDFKRIHQDHNVQECVGLIANHTLKFCKKHKKKLIFSGKGDINSKNFKRAERMFYKNQIQNYDYDISFHKKTEFENYRNIINSNLIIGMCSTMLRDSFEFKRKILWCNFIDHKDVKSPSEGICTLRSKKFEDFENRVLEILKLDYEEYLSKIENVDAFYNTKVNALKYLKNEINL